MTDYYPEEKKTQVEADLLTQKITIDNVHIKVSEEARHVGILRSSQRNGAYILDRLSAHRKTIFCLLRTGIALSHSANPAASIKLDRIYANPVLLSGLATLVLSRKEESILEHHYKVHLQRLLRLHEATPAPVVYTLAGRPPLVGQLHLKILQLFGQICRLKDGNNFLARQASYSFSTLPVTRNSKSWFIRIHFILLQYSLPSPTLLLS